MGEFDILSSAEGDDDIVFKSEKDDVNVFVNRTTRTLLLHWVQDFVALREAFLHLSHVRHVLLHDILNVVIECVALDQLSVLRCHISWVKLG